MSTDHLVEQRFHRRLTRSDLRFHRAEPTATSRFRKFARFKTPDAPATTDMSAEVLPDGVDDSVIAPSRSDSET